MKRYSANFFLALIIFALGINGQTRLPIGMNIDGNNYYSQCLVYNDVMKTASAWISFNAEGDSPWDTELIDRIPFDSAGYPVTIPFTPIGEVAQKVRFLINNNYFGTYLLLFDGDGDLSIHNTEYEQLSSNKYTVELTGYTKHVWIDIERSSADNRIQNMRIIPSQYEDQEEQMPLFYDKFLEGLEPFHAIRFMDWMRINNSEQKEWQDRSKPYYYSHGLSNGMPIEHAIELCNTLQADAWFCVPHQADDDFHIRFAEMVRDQLDNGLKVYIEYSNEVWNWIFDQSHYVGQNAPGHNNQYVIDDLTAIHPIEYIHPEKDAYMMQRTFRLWSEVFTGADSDRLVRVATGQHAWMDNTRRVLEYLFKHNIEGNPHTDPIYTASTGAGCDAFSVAGYFNFQEEHHLQWNGMDPAEVTSEMIIDSVFAIYDETSGHWTNVTAEFVNAFGVDYLVYEGGQHMQPYLQGEYDYNPAVWDAQIHPKMYDLYMYNFQKHLEPEVNCQLFMAFSYVSERESRWGSWGHLESLQQVGTENYMDIAPKYQALLDINIGLPSSVKRRDDQLFNFDLEQNYPNPFNPETHIRYSIPQAGKVTTILYNVLGQKVKTLFEEFQPAGYHVYDFYAGDLPSGVYFYEIQVEELSRVRKMLLMK